MLHATMFAFYTGIHGIHVDFTSSARAQVPRQRCPHRPSISSLLISLFAINSYSSRKKSSLCDTSQKLQTRQVTFSLGRKSHGAINSLGRAHLQTPIPTSNPLVLPAQCQDKRSFRIQLTLTLDITTFAAAPSRHTILAAQRRHARGEERA